MKLSNALNVFIVLIIIFPVFSPAFADTGLREVTFVVG